MNKINEEAASYLMVLLNLVQDRNLTVKEALQRAHQHGLTHGKIEGLEIAKQIVGAPIQ
jgi:hypothetical protein